MQVCSSENTPTDEGQLRVRRALRNTKDFGTTIGSHGIRRPYDLRDDELTK
jgi:hypothetical protein